MFRPGFSCATIEIVVVIHCKIAILLLLMTGCWHEVKDSSTHGIPWKGLALEARLANIEGDSLKIDKPIHIIVTFNNLSKNEIIIPMIKGGNNFTFFDYIILRELMYGTIVINSGFWNEPSVKRVNVITIEPNTTVDIDLKVSLRPPAHIFEKETIQIVIVYRDHSYGYGFYNDKDEVISPNIWKGMILSNPVRIDKWD